MLSFMLSFIRSFHFISSHFISFVHPLVLSFVMPFHFKSFMHSCIHPFIHAFSHSVSQAVSQSRSFFFRDISLASPQPCAHSLMHLTTSIFH
jgi:hypothetical protein